jgi:hypothetical protein
MMMVFGEEKRERERVVEGGEIYEEREDAVNRGFARNFCFSCFDDCARQFKRGAEEGKERIRLLSLY